jgi:hypothetical protein
MDELKTILTLIQGGGSAGLIVSTYFIYRASERLARIEKALQKYMDDNNNAA